jgi:hypothetical protein
VCIQREISCRQSSGIFPQLKSNLIRDMGIGEQGDVRNAWTISAEKSVFCRVVFDNVQRIRPMNMAFFIFRHAFGGHFLIILNKPRNGDKGFMTVLFEKQPFICFGAFDPQCWKPRCPCGQKSQNRICFSQCIAIVQGYEWNFSIGVQFFEDGFVRISCQNINIDSIVVDFQNRTE